MRIQDAVSRRKFMGAVSAAMGFLGLAPQGELIASSLLQGRGQRGQRAGQAGDQGGRRNAEDYDALAKLANNENPYGPSESVTKAMTDAFKYANRYGYPDGGVNQAIAQHHNLKPENILTGAGSGEILNAAGQAFLKDPKLVVGAEPTYGSVFSVASGIKKDAIRVPLLPDYRLDIPGIIKATHTHYRDVGFVYICNPNNPTGVIVTKQEIQQLLDGIPGDVPVLIDEAYHHYVNDPNYATSVPYVIEGRPVIVARTFSKIAALAGVRFGYALAPRELIEQMRTYSTGSTSALAKWAVVASLKDGENEAKVKSVTLALREKTMAQLKDMGYDVIPSQANFFMVHVKTDITPVIEEFRKRKVLVGRKFPPMDEYLRVSVGNESEMDRFIAAFKEISPGRQQAQATKPSA